MGPITKITSRRVSCLAEDLGLDLVEVVEPTSRFARQNRRVLLATPCLHRSRKSRWRDTRARTETSEIGFVRRNEVQIHRDLDVSADISGMRYEFLLISIKEESSVFDFLASVVHLKVH